MSTSGTTTIEVSTALRDRIAREARAQSVSAAELIDRLLDEHERRSRFQAVRAAYATVDPGYLAETEEWNAPGSRPVRVATSPQTGMTVASVGHVVTSEDVRALQDDE